jgi:predicted hydrocarbon binding protein
MLKRRHAMPSDGSAESASTVRKYAFSWDLLGDLESGRPNLGPLVRLETYRLLQFTLRDVLEQRYGTSATDDVFRAAGRLSGAQFYEHLVLGADGFDDYIAKLQSVLREMSVGVLRVERADLETGKFVLTVSEDLDCSGLPEAGDQVCVYDEGFLAALLKGFTGRDYEVEEVDCWCTGDRTCRFTAEPT